MLVKYGSFFAFLLITVSWASSSDNGKDFAFQFSQVGEALIDEALNTPEISSQLTSSSHAILSSIATKNEYAMRYYDFAIQSYDFRNLGFDSVDPKYWNAFISYPFPDFSCQQRDQAQIIVNEIVLPHHPFLAQVPFRFHIADFLDQDQRIFDIDFFLDKVAYNNFSQEFSQILALDDPSEAHILLKALLHKAKNTSFPDLDFKYHHAFIANAPFQYFKRINYSHEHHKNINSFISELAPALYSEIAEDSKQLADKILAGLLPSIYSKLTDTSYEIAIRKYQESLLQPIDKSYLWDPQQLHSDLIEALQALSIVENFNLRPYIKIIEFIVDDSPLAHLFRHYIAQNFCKPSNLPPQHKPLFWRSLIFTSITDFSTICPYHSNQIIEKLQLPSLDQVKSVFVQGLLGDQFSSEVHFRLVSAWGHTTVFAIVLQIYNDISFDDVYWALENVSQSGCTSIVELLLQSNHVISAYDCGRALISASENGHASVVVLLLQSRADIPDYRVGWALIRASNNGHTHVVELLLQSRTDIPAESLAKALISASESGYISIIERLLYHRNDIPADDIGRVLRDASENGHATIVVCLLHYCHDIPTDGVGLALIRASENGHTTIVERLLHYRHNIPADRVGSALIRASEKGHTTIVERLLHYCHDIPTDHAGLALIRASENGHTTIVERLLHYRHNIPADRVGLALIRASENGHTTIVERLLHYCHDIPADLVGLALIRASENGHAPVVELLRQFQMNH
jgi:ankyrin repeat protein